MPLYLSRLILNQRSRQVRREVAEPYEMHRTLMHAFPQLTTEEEQRKMSGAVPGRILWRLDLDRHTGKLVVHVQSAALPDWGKVTSLCTDYCLDPAEADVDENPAGPKDVSNIFQFKTGQPFAFRLRANPTVKKKVEGGKNGRRLGLIDDADQLAWLARKGENGGFQLLSAAALREDAPNNLSKGTKHNGNDEAKLSLLSVRFEGHLAVSDPGKFLDTLRIGIGPGKAFGFGLLSLARV